MGFGVLVGVLRILCFFIRELRTQEKEFRVRPVVGNSPPGSGERVIQSTKDIYKTQESFFFKKGILADLAPD